VPGLVIETATLAGFEALARDLAPEMIEDNGDGESGDRAARVEFTWRGEP